MSDLVKRLRSENTMHGYYDAPAIQIEAADLIEKLSEDLLHSQTRETEYEEGFTEGLHVGAKNASDLVVAVRDLMKTIAGLVNNGTLELKSDKEAGQFLTHALNRVEEAMERIDQQ